MNKNNPPQIFIHYTHDIFTYEIPIPFTKLPNKLIRNFTMCGRFENKPSVQSLVVELKKHKVDLQIDPSLTKENNDAKAENIAPTNKIFSVKYNDKDYFLTRTNWGIKFSADSPLIFNSRIETIKEKKFWMSLFTKNISLVPMTAFYEWKKEGTKKIPYRIFLPDEKIFFVPALNFMDKDKKIFTSLITTTPNDFMQPIHHRMPVILKIKDGINFLTNDPDTNLSQCIPYAGKMDLEPASI